MTTGEIIPLDSRRSSIFGDAAAGFSVSSVTLWFNSRPHHRVTEAHVRERNRYAEYKKSEFSHAAYRGIELQKRQIPE